MGATFSGMTATEKSGLLQLPANGRAELAELLLRSFDGPEQAEIDAAWARESEERIAAFDRGEINAVDGEAAMAERRRKFPHPPFSIRHHLPDPRGDNPHRLRDGSPPAPGQLAGQSLISRLHRDSPSIHTS